MVCMAESSSMEGKGVCCKTEVEGAAAEDAMLGIVAV